ncbi:DNA repair protein O [Lactobacillus selangorensis]|uniref:DNA repair protein RecO n=1 Tax=Lactobacillus selangorensis TaxID=81857 RepID=A0A0R2FLS1_9LACO|nr:DNA repair protein RecO [Lactobacillus selangorensis]KRN29522.1 DNA repair protein O [Lactobacillus selangorensis]KRN33948.1 DNA repair protein O [Lactobacillus selangorensis]
MAQHALEEFEGIVIYRKNYREKDMLVKMITDQFGKKMFFLRGANRPKFRMRAAILPFTIGTYVGNLSDEGLSFINTAKEYRQFQTIGSDIFLNAYATYILNLIDVAFPDSVPIPQWYAFAKQALNLIDDGFDAEIIMDIAQIQLLPAFGVGPHWQDCVICHRTKGSFDYSEKYGGILCDQHWQLDPYRLHVDQRTMYYLRLFSVVDLMKLHSIDVKKETKQRLKRVIDVLYRDTVGIHLKSKHFIDEMNGWEDRFKAPDQN